MHFCIRQQRTAMQGAESHEIEWLINVNQIKARRFSFNHRVLLSSL
jgi:hypothetical protein